MRMRFETTQNIVAIHSPFTITDHFFPRGLSYEYTVILLESAFHSSIFLGKQKYLILPVLVDTIRTSGKGVCSYNLQGERQSENIKLIRSQQILKM